MCFPCDFFLESNDASFFEQGPPFIAFLECIRYISPPVAQESSLPSLVVLNSLLFFFLLFHWLYSFRGCSPFRAPHLKTRFLFCRFPFSFFFSSRPLSPGPPPLPLDALYRSVFFLFTHFRPLTQPIIFFLLQNFSEIPLPFSSGRIFCIDSSLLVPGPPTAQPPQWIL